jgi:hypothetical protein
MMVESVSSRPNAEASWKSIKDHREKNPKQGKGDVTNREGKVLWHEEVV